ncbi:MAG TPA: RsmE family RNA methyltransferase, partial [Clostridia bacterium]
ITERTVVKLGSLKDSQKKTERWRRIALEAAKQSNRGVVPYVYEPLSFKEAITNSEDSELRLIPYEKEKSVKLSNCLREAEAKKVSVFIGPEGGYSEEEIEKAEVGGVVPVSLGPRILRTETAGLMVLSILMYALGDVGQ